MSHREAMCTVANVGVGTHFKPREIIDARGTKAKLNQWLDSHGLRSPLCRASRAAKLYREIEAGRVSAETAKNLRRDYAKEFADIEKSLAKQQQPKGTE
jgi:hypothetical protein